MNIDTANIGALEANTRTRPDLIGDPRPGSPTTSAWFDKKAFAAPKPFTFGSAGRNQLRTDGYQNFDLSLFREDKLTERLKMQFRAEFFNAFNNVTFGVPQVTFTNPRFGEVSGTISNARQIQLGLKLLF